MLKYLKGNRLVNLILVPGFALFFWGLLWLKPDWTQTVESTGFYFAAHRLINPLLGYREIALVAVLALSVILVFLVINLNARLRIIEANTYLHGYIFLMLIHTLGLGGSLIPLLVAEVFLVLVFYAVFDSYKRELAIVNFFWASICLALGSFFFPFMAFLLPFIWIALYYLRPFNYREWAVTLFGFLTPFYLHWAWCFLFDIDWLSWISAYLGAFRPSFFALNMSRIELVYHLVVALLVAVSYVYLTSRESLKIQSRKLNLLFVWLLSLLLLLIVFYSQYTMHLALFGAIPIAFLFSGFLYNLRSFWWGNGLFLIFFVLAVLIWGNVL